MSCQSASCSPKSAAAEGERPLTLLDLQPADQLVIRGARQVAFLGRARAPLEDLAASLVPGATLSPAMAHLQDFLSILDDADGPEIELRRPACKGLTVDEVAMARTLAAVRDNDFAAARAHAARLTSPARLGTVLAAAFALVGELAQLGQVFTFQAPAVAMRAAAPAVC